MNNTRVNCRLPFGVAVVVAAVIMGATTSAAQTIPAERRVDWARAGAQDTSTAGFHVIDLGSSGFVGDGTTANDNAMDSVLRAWREPGMILRIPEGTFLFSRGIRLPSRTVLRGASAERTTLLFDLGGRGDAITIAGRAVPGDSAVLTGDARRGSSIIVVERGDFVRPGDMVLLQQRDDDLVTSDWAVGGTGQLVRVSDIRGDTVTLDMPLRRDNTRDRVARVLRVDPVHSIGMECLTIERRDDTAPEQGKNILFSFARDCWVRGVESRRCTFAHIAAEFSSRVSVRSCYLHHAFDYGGGGRGYGIALQFATGDCLVEDCVFEHLRHAMLLQAGANGNVFANNFSTDPYWNDSNPLLPSDAAGDVVLHGNYPYANLFEHNIVANIVIDNSHGPNGPYNTFFRNRATLYGVFFSANNSPLQNVVGNEITNTALPYSLVNFTVRGEGHFLHGNNDKGRIHPPGSEWLPDSSLAYVKKPDCFGALPWPGIGTPFAFGIGTIPARERYLRGDPMGGVCEPTIATLHGLEAIRGEIVLHPNPVRSLLTLEHSPGYTGRAFYIIDANGGLRVHGRLHRERTIVDASILPCGVYMLLVDGVAACGFVRH